MLGKMCIFARVKHILIYKPMSDKKIDPEVVKLIVKIALYALTAIASFLGGNAVAQNFDVHLIG